MRRAIIIILILLPAGVSQGATYYVTQAATGGGVGSEGDPFTLEEACDNYGAGDTIYVKADGTYIAEYDTGGAKSSIMYLTVDGTAGSPVHWIGYATTPGDGGVAKLDADDNALEDALEGTAFDYHSFENMIFDGGTDSAIDGTNGNNCVYKNCVIEGAGDEGMWRPGSGSVWLFCQIRNNAQEGIDAIGSNYVFHGCEVYGNGAEGIHVGSTATFSDCEFYNNTYVDIQGDAQSLVIIGCTLDGEGADPLVYCTAAGGTPMVFINSILYDGTYAVSASAGISGVFSACMLNSNDTNFNNVTPISLSEGDNIGDYGNDTTNAPGFVNEASDDYDLAVGSSARDSAYDVRFSKGFWGDKHGGTNPPTTSNKSKGKGSSQPDPVSTGAFSQNKSGNKV